MKASRIIKALAFGLFLLIFITGLGGSLTGARAQTGPSPEDPFVPAGETKLPAQAAAGPASPCGGGGCVPASGGWQIAAPLPVGVFGASVASDGVYMYAAGGYNWDTMQPVDQFARYDPIANTWASLASLPTAVEGALGVFAEGKVYVFGGRDSSTTALNLVQVYTIASDSWSSSLTTLPVKRHDMGGGYWNGMIYAAGGYEADDDVSERNQLWRYSIAGNSWTTLADLPSPLASPASGVINGHLYIVGGRNAGTSASNTNFDYDIKNNFWTARALLPVAANAPGGVAYRGSLWVFGGGMPFAPLSKAFIYSPAFDAWTAGPSLNVARSYQGAAVVRNRIVSVGGYNGGSSDAVEVAVQNPLRILIVYADTTPPTTLKTRLLLQPGVGQVDLFHATTATATYPMLWNYDLVVAFSNSPWNDPILQGNEIATYLDQGGAVVAFNFAWEDYGLALAGNWTSGGYSPFLTPGENNYKDAGLGSFNAGHPLMAGVQALNAFYRQKLVVAAGATEVASWNTIPATPLVAFKGQAVGVSAYVGSAPLNSWSGDFPALIVNAGYWLRTGNGSCTNLTCPKTIVINGSITANDPVVTPRLWRGAPPSTCDAPKTCPGVSGSGNYHYDAHLFYNNTQAEQCVTATLDPGTCLGNTAQALHASAYNNFLPTDQCSGYLADLGSSPGSPASFSFKAAANSVYMIVVNEANPSGFCPSYTLTVSAGACEQNTITKTFVPSIRR